MRTIYAAEYGIRPGTDVTAAMRELFLRYPADTVYVFEKGDYFLSPTEEMRADYRLSNTNGMPCRVLGLWMQQMERCVFQGNGARLWFAGQMQPITVDHCRDIRIENFIIDWKKPMVAESEVVSYTEDAVDLYIDPQRYPHRFAGDTLEFDVGADEWYPLAGMVQYDKGSRCIRRVTGAGFALDRIEELGNDVYRFFSRKPVDTDKGNIFVLRHNSRTHAAIFAEKCVDLVLEDITVHSCGGLGCLAQFCHNVTCRRVNFVPDTEAGRRITSGRDDGMQITCCSGVVTITECVFNGLMDDPINIHGCCVAVEEAVDHRTLRCRYRHEQSRGFLYWAEKGDEIAVIERRHMSQAGTLKAASYSLESLDTFLLTLEEPLTGELLAMAKDSEGLALDNLSHTAALICTKNRFGSCRARGVLVSTPKPVVIAENYFESSGSSILVAGDSNYWFESGECNDVEIRDNVFTNQCLSAMYQFCEGVISICPVVPEPLVSMPYHKNIRITGNLFDSADTPVLYAYSCGGLTFAKNRIFKSYAADSWYPGDWLIKLAYCRKVTLADNERIGKFGLKHFVVTEECEDVTLS